MVIVGSGPHRWRMRRRGRRPKPRRISLSLPEPILYTPSKTPTVPPRTICLEADEVEALRLVYYEGYTQEETAMRMGVSRGTLWRLLESARRKRVAARVEQRPLLIQSPELDCSMASMA